MYASYRKLSDELKDGRIVILPNQVVFKNSQNIFLSITQEMLGLLEF